METFVLTAHLRTPVIHRGSMTLDALLMAELGEGDVSHLLHCEDSLYWASAGFPVQASGTQTACFVASMRPEHTPGWLDLIQPNTKGGDVEIDTARQRRGGNIINAYAATMAQAVQWYATGHPAAVLAVVQAVLFIGKRRSAGYGEVERWSVEPGPLDGLVGLLGEPLRPIPTERWVGGGNWIPLEAAWKAPYWDVRNRTRCYVPGVSA